MLERGSRLGHYEIHSQLGAGGMGEVILPRVVASDSERMKRFVQEAKAASGLNHPNIVTIYEVGQADSTPFIATEFIDGSTLRERMRAHLLPLEEVLNVAVQIATALDAAHANGIVHRDIKPENIILRRDGIAKVVDFGLAKLTSQGSELVDGETPTRDHFKTESGVVMGTATYMSPEQGVDSRSMHARTSSVLEW